VVETAWPPKSPHAALLSSPSGRRKYQQCRDHRERSLSPTKRSTTLPSLQRASRKLFDNDEDMNEVDDLEDDEETLHLKLAAIEAKLKLKKLQQNREKDAVAASGNISLRTTGPQSSTSSTSVPKSSQNFDRFGSTTVDIPVSPTRKTVPQAEQRSPGRVLLGIDKGVKGTDVSLRRARSIRENGTFGNDRTNSGTDARKRRARAPESIPESHSGHNVARPARTFSERMAENRAEEQTQEKRREAIGSKRGVGFKLDRAEMESFQKAAVEARTHNPPRSPLKDRQSATFSRDDVVRSQPLHLPDSRRFKRSPTLPMHRDTESGSSSISKKVLAAHQPSQENQPFEGESLAQNGEVRHTRGPSFYDPFSQLYLTSRILPHSFLERTFPSETHSCLRLPQLLKQVTAPAYELPGLSTKDVVIVGVVASKSTPLDHKKRHAPHSAANVKSSDEWENKWDDGSQNHMRFMVLQLSDLTWSVDLYLFGTALPRYHRLSPGTVVAILNPGIMPPKKGKEDTGAFSLTLHHGDDTLLEIGTAKHLGFCVAMKKDGHACGSWVNLTKTEICEWHLNAEITKTQAGRMGVNTGSNAMGRGVAGNRLRYSGVQGGTGSHRGPLPTSRGQQFDRNSQSHYFITSKGGSQSQTNCTKNGEFFQRSAATLMELDDEDPFIAEGRLSRDTETRLKKRLLDEEKERLIAQKLTSMGSGGAGGEYLRHRITPNPDGRWSASNANDEVGKRKSAMATKDNIMMAGIKTDGKRSAETVRLSPMKKTRFVTEKGIKEAGRESLGCKKVDQEDGLDIV
jgi:minichromosome maintenance protein 10